MYNKINRLFLIAGHYEGDPGAVASHTFKAGEIKFKEADFVREFRDLLITEFNARLLPHDILKDNDSHNLSTVLGMLRNGTDKTDLVIDFHLNASSNPNATGVECFIKDDFRPLEKEIASNLCNIIAGVLNAPNRGLKTQKQSNRGTLGILKVPALVVLVEIGFLSNPSETKNMVQNKHILVSKVADAIQDSIR